MNKRGPRIDPCGTPHVTDSVLESAPCRCTYYFLLLK